MDVVQACNGLEVQIELSSRRFMGLKERRARWPGVPAAACAALSSSTILANLFRHCRLLRPLIWRTSILRLST
jgi:hypothetical protein